MPRYISAAEGTSHTACYAFSSPLFPSYGIVMFMSTTILDRLLNRNGNGHGNLGMVKEGEEGNPTLRPAVATDILSFSFFFARKVESESERFTKYRQRQVGLC